MTGGDRRLMRDWRGWLLAALTAGFALAAHPCPGDSAAAVVSRVRRLPRFLGDSQFLQRRIQPAVPDRRRAGAASHLERWRPFHRRARAAALPGVLPRCSAHLSRLGVLPRGPGQPAPGLGSAADDPGVCGPGGGVDRRARGSEARSAVIVAAAAARCGHGHLLVRHRTQWDRQPHAVCGLSGLVHPRHRAAAGRLAGAALHPWRAAGVGGRSGTDSPRSSRPSICRSFACSAAH